MKVSQKATYGIMAALDLALQNGAAPVQSKAIAKRQVIPPRFLEQVLHAMKKAGIHVVESPALLGETMESVLTRRGFLSRPRAKATPSLKKRRYAAKTGKVRGKKATRKASGRRKR